MILKVIVLWLSTLPLQARIFDMKESHFGGYFQASSGSSAVGDDFFVGESSATDFSRGFTTQSGGEFGFLYRTDKVAWIFGIEMIRPPKIRGTASAGGTVNYNYISDLSVFTPKLGLECFLYETNSFRFFVNASAGTASFSFKTDYQNLTIAPNADFSIEGKSTANSLNYGFGGEWHMADNTTFVISVNSRQLNFTKMTYLKDVAASFNGAQSKGQRIVKSDGSPLEYDFTQYYYTVGFRFWLH
jgi:hypothetical protein